MKTNDVKSDVNAHSKNTPQNVNVRRKKTLKIFTKHSSRKLKNIVNPQTLLDCIVEFSQTVKSLGSIAIRMIKVNGHGLVWGLIQQ